MEKGKRVKGTLKEKENLWNEGGKVWAAYGVTVDKAAENLLAEVFEFDTYAMQQKHLKENGNLVRKFRKNVDGTRSMHFQTGIKLTALDNRLFESWHVWKKTNVSNVGANYMVGFVPLSEYSGRKFEEKEDYKSGESTGIYIIEAIAPNVCRVTRIQHVDLNITGLPIKALKILAKVSLLRQTGCRRSLGGMQRRLTRRSGRC